PPLARTAAGKWPGYFDSRPRTTSPRGQTTALRNFRLGKAAQIFLLSRDRHAVQQIISKCASALSELLDIVPEPVPHHCYANCLNVLGQTHVASVHQRPCLGRMQQSQTGAWRQTSDMTLSRGIEQIL